MSFSLPQNVFEDPSTVDLTEKQEKTSQALAAFLRLHRTDAGDILLDDESVPWTEKQMNDLVEVIKRSGDERRMIEFFRVFRKLAVCWIMRHGTDAPLPKSPIPIPELENPSSISLAGVFRDYRKWAEWLAEELERSSPKRRFAALPTIGSVVPLLASSIMYGGLWNEQSLVTLLRAIPELLSSTMATRQAIYIGLTLPWRELPVAEFRCWQPDPLTAILLFRTDVSAVEKLIQPAASSKSGRMSDAEILHKIMEQFQYLGSGVPGRSKLKRLMVCARTIGANCMPSTIARYASRKFISSSLSLPQIQRISDREWLYGLPFRPAQQVIVPADQQVQGVLEGTPFWAGSIESAILRRDLRITIPELDALNTRTDLPPLAMRLIDFVRRTIVLPTASRSTTSFDAFARRTLILAAAMQHEWGEADPADLPDEKLAAGYKALVGLVRDMDPSGDSYRDLLHSLRLFHSYMRNCLGKRRLKERGLLVPRSVLDRVDVDILSTREYQRLHGEINLKWPGIEHEGRREAAHGLAQCGFHWGTRREEARLARMGDLQPTELLVRASDDHTLKSPAAERRLPDICIPADEESALRQWHQKRSEQFRDQDYSFDYLFSDKVNGHDPVPPSIFRALNQLISKITGTLESDQPTHYHHLRHRMSSFLLLRMLLPQGATPPEYLQEEDADWLLAGEHSRPEELRRRTQPWGSDVFLVGQLLGHLHPATTYRYFHFAGELLRIYMQRSPWLQPAASMLSAATGGELGAEQIDARSAMQFAIELLGRKAKSDPRSQGKDVRLPVPGENSFYEDLLKWRQFLRYIQTTDGPVYEACEFFGWAPERAEAVVRRAESLRAMRSSNGSFRQRFRTSRSESGEPIRTLEPAWPNSPRDLEVFQIYASRIEELARDDRTRAALLQGCNAYVKSVWEWNNFAVFHNPGEDGEGAAAFLHLLDILGLLRKDIRFLSFDKERSESRCEWRTVLGLSKKTRFWPRRPPHGEREATRSWIGIEPTFGPNLQAGDGTFGFRCLLVTSFIVLSAQ